MDIHIADFVGGTLMTYFLVPSFFLGMKVNKVFIGKISQIALNNDLSKEKFLDIESKYYKELVLKIKI